MRILLKGAEVFLPSFFSSDIAIEDGVIRKIAPKIASSGFDRVFDLKGKVIFSGFVDVHTHLREPDFSYKETILSGTQAAAKGGYVTVFAMPNLNPVPDSLKNLQVELDIIKKDAKITVIPFGAISKGQKGEVLSEMEELAPYVCAFSDDGKGVPTVKLMEEAMRKAKTLGKLIVAHAEDLSLIEPCGAIHEGKYAFIHNIPSISSASEWKQVERDLELVKKTGAAYHVCHVSTKETVELIRRSKEDGLNVTCETAPHYLTLTEDDLIDDGRFKMNPPLRGIADKEALIEGIKDGTVDIIATDHAPHSEEEKAKGLRNSLMGITGIETAFPVLYTKLVKSGVITLETLIEKLTTAPRKIFELKSGKIEEGQLADLTVIDLNKEYVITKEGFLSKGKASPYIGERVFGETVLTIASGKVAYVKE